VATNSFRHVRGRTILCSIFDEVAYWRDERSATPDVETYTAVMPGLSTLPGSMAIGISSPYRRAGLLYDKYRRHYGRDEGDVLVIRAPSLVLNPTLDPKVVADAFEADPAAARAEWLGEFRDDIAAFLNRDLVEAAVDHSVLVRPPVSGIGYHGFVDPSGGVGDSFTAAVAHAEQNNVAVIDCLSERTAPFNPDAATNEMAGMFKSYGVREIVGDHYTARWVVEAFAKRGIKYTHSSRDRSAIYLDVLPLFTSGRLRLVDNKKLVTQFVSLERRTSPSGKDRIDHGDRGHDDLCNAASGAAVLAIERLKARVPIVAPPDCSSRAVVGRHGRWGPSPDGPRSLTRTQQELADWGVPFFSNRPP
jgi:hypothetical protein